MLSQDDERRRLMADNVDGASDVAAVAVLVQTESSQLLLKRCREVLVRVLDVADSEWPSLDDWMTLLPQWFVDACGPEQTQEESERWLTWWRSLPADKQLEVEEAQPWALSEWLEWLRPSERTWYWLGSSVIDRHTLIIWLDTPGSPSPTGALEWLLKAAGATEVQVD